MTRTLLVLALAQLGTGLGLKWLLPYLGLSYTGTMIGVCISGICIIGGFCVGVMAIATALVEVGDYGKRAYQKGQRHRRGAKAQRR